MKCFVCEGEVPIDGQVVLNFGAMESHGDGTASIPENPQLVPILSVSRHDHQNPGGWWDADDIDLRVRTNGQADIHFCGPDCLDELFRRISAAVRAPHQ